MTDKLSDRIEAASAGSRELDAEIAGTDATTVMWHDEEETPRYTTSLDAAMTLVPEGALMAVRTYAEPGVYPAHVRASAWVQGSPRCFAATPALALCAAALRAQKR